MSSTPQTSARAASSRSGRSAPCVALALLLLNVSVAECHAIGSNAVTWSSESPTAASHSGPRLILTTRGISTPELRSIFSEMLEAAHTTGALTVSVVITAAMTSQPTPGSEGTVALMARREEAASASKALVVEAGLPDSRLILIDAARDTPEDMAAALNRSSCIFVLGGNTFYLLHHMRRSGLDALVRRRVHDGAVYVGMSAGSIVAGRSVATAFWKGVRAVAPSASRAARTHAPMLTAPFLSPCARSGTTRACASATGRAPRPSTASASCPTAPSFPIMRTCGHPS